MGGEVETRGARGYSWETATAENKIALRHGFWAAPLLRADDRAEVAEIAAAITELMPLKSDSFGVAVEQLAAKIWRQRRGLADISEHGLVRDGGAPAGLLVDLSKLERSIMRDLVELGLTPRSAAALGIDVIAGKRALSIVEYYRALADSGLPAHDGDGGGGE